VRDANRRLAAGLWVAVAAGIVIAVSPRVSIPRFPAAAGSLATRGISAGSGGPSVPSAGGTGAARSRSSRAPEAGALVPGTYIPEVETVGPAVPVAELTARVRAYVAPLRRLRSADLLVIGPQALPAGTLRDVRRLRGVADAEMLDAARVKVNGSLVAVLGVDPSSFRAFAAAPTARSSALWQNVADGGIAVSYLMGKQESLPLGGTVQVTGTSTEELRVGGFGTVGISGVDAVVSDQVAQSLGLPAGNAIVISAPRARLSVLMREIALLLPKDATVDALVAQATAEGLPVTTGSAGGVGITASDGPGLSVAQTRAFLTAAESRVGLPYVWGGSGPKVFDCSGLVQWSMRQAGITMPRVAVDQAQTGPLIPLSQLEPGDLLFYHTDPTAPTYISHVAIYIGNGMMEQAPEPGMDVQIVPAVLDGGFAGAVQVYPRVAAAVAGDFSG
jgi:peptidoglycan DL-endopeptidase CwlO